MRVQKQKRRRVELTVKTVKPRETKTVTSYFDEVTYPRAWVWDLGSELSLSITAALTMQNFQQT